MPDLTGIKIEPETVVQLSAHSNIIGIKDSSADIAGLQKTVTLVHEDFAVLSGNGTVFCTALEKGARGAILAVGCVAAALCLEIYRLVKVGEAEGAAALQEKLTPLALAVTKRYGIGGLKAAMDMIGFAGGAVRAPLKPAGAEAQAEIAALLDQLKSQSVSRTEVRGEQGEFAGEDRERQNLLVTAHLKSRGESRHFPSNAFSPPRLFLITFAIHLRANSILSNRFHHELPQLELEVLPPSIRLTATL